MLIELWNIVDLGCRVIKWRWPQIICSDFFFFFKWRDNHKTQFHFSEHFLYMSALCCLCQTTVLSCTRDSQASFCQQTIIIVKEKKKKKNLYDKNQNQSHAHMWSHPETLSERNMWEETEEQEPIRQTETGEEVSRETHFTLTSALLPPLLLCFSSGCLSFSFQLRFVLCFPVVLRWILWTMLAAQRTSSLRPVSRTWETSTTSLWAPVECRSTSALYAGTAPQVMSEVKDGQTWSHSHSPLPLTLLKAQKHRDWLSHEPIKLLFLSPYVDMLFANVD